MNMFRHKPGFYFPFTGFRSPDAAFRFPAFILIICLMSAMGAGCGPDEKSASKQSVMRAPDDWTGWRGGPSFTGVADAKLPDHPDLVWRYQAGDEIVSTPVVSDGRVYFGSLDGVFHAVDLRSGRLFWTDTTGSSIESPALCLNQQIIVGTVDETLIAYDTTGARTWTYRTGGKIVGSANWKSVYHENYVYVGSYDSKMHCVRAQTGEPVWAFDTKNFINGAPAIEDSLLVFGGCDALLHVLSTNSGKQIAAVGLNSYVAGSPSVYQKRAYAGTYDAQLYCVDLISRSVVWMYEDEEDGEAFFSCPAIAGDRLVIGSRDGRVHCVDIRSGKRVWTFRTQGDVDSSPVIADHSVLFGSADGRFYRISLDKGELIWSYDTGSSITGSPALAGGFVLIGAEDGALYAFGVKDQD